MKLHNDYSISEIAGNAFLVPIGAAIVDMGKMMDLNETSLFIVELLKDNDMTVEELTEALFEEFDADMETIRADVEVFVENGKKNGFIVD